MEDLDHHSIAVVAPLEHRGSQGHKPPEEVERFLRIGLGNLLDGCATLSM
jgi:hypothetical protein